MPKFKEERPMPGDMVRIRGTTAQPIWAEPGTQRAGIVMPNSVGLVISSSHQSPHRSYAYVLWSIPTVCGWIPDGVMERVI